MLLFTLGATGATLLVVLGLLSIPAINACHGDSRGPIGCIRQLVEQRFDLPGGLPAPRVVEETVSAVAELAETAEPGVPPDASVALAAPDAPAIPEIVDQPRPEASPADTEAPLDAPAPQIVVPAEARPDDTLPPAESPLSDAAPVPADASLPPEQPEQPIVAELPDAAVTPTAPLVVADLTVPEVESQIITRSLGPEVEADGAAPTALADFQEITTVPPVIPDSIPPLPPPEAEDVPDAGPDPVADAPGGPSATLDPALETLAAPALPPALAAVLDAFDPQLLLPPGDAVPPADQPVAASGLDTPEPVAGVAPVDVAIAELPPAPLQPDSVATPILPPTIDAIEIDGEASFAAGDGPAGALMRLYVDGVLVGESPVEAGRWLVEGVELFTRPSQVLRVDAVEPETGRVLSSTAISFEIELPAPEEVPLPAARAIETAPDATPGAAVPGPELPAEPPPMIASPQQPAAVPEAAEAAEEPATLPAEALPVITAPVEVAPEVVAARPETVADGSDAADADAVLATGNRAPEAPPLVEAEAAPGVLPMIRPVVPKGETASVIILGVPPAENLPKALTGPSELDAATIAGRPPAVIAHFDSPEVAGSIVVLRAVPYGDPGAGRFVSGKAIIRRGDTLWDIAHRYYGRGIRYDTIVGANRDQIARPSRIYPGQVFDLPLVYDD